MSETVSSVVPIGTIAAYAGELDTGWLEKQGWLYCDGAEVKKADYADLFFAVGANFGGTRTTFFLPDLRGRFERGVDALAKRDPYAQKRPASAAGGLAGDNPGSIQQAYTALPNKQFYTPLSGTHTHPVPHMPTNASAGAIAGSHYGIWTDDASRSEFAGAHTHIVVGGGDRETRPANKYVYFIIKFAG